jgi:transaldolase
VLFDRLSQHRIASHRIASHRIASHRGEATSLRSSKRIRLFLDSAVDADWNAWLPIGLFYGATTNPTLLARAGLRCDMETIYELVRAAFAFDIEELHVQTWGESVEAMLVRGREIAALDPRIVVKVPITLEGVAVVRALRAAGIRTTFTALYAPHQALTAAVVEAEYAAPYLGRISDTGRDGHAEVVAMHEILRASGSPTRLLVASIRTAADLGRLARAGLDTYTIGERVASDLFSDPDTAAATAVFEAAAG